jgi:ketosteroid isomerase-like protein
MSRHLPLALLLAALPVHAAQEQDQAIHQELRAILETVQGAINNGNFDAMLPVVSKDIRATPVNQEVLSSHADVSEYFRRWFGPGGVLAKLDMEFDADTLTELSPDKTWGLVRGKGDERYTLANGKNYDLATRWTATIAKESDGKWRLRAIHIGTNFLDNPVLAEAKDAVTKFALLAGIGGLVVGSGLGFFLARSKK